MSKQLWSGYFIGFYDDGTLGVSDGVGYAGQEQDARGLYEAMKKYFEEQDKK